MSIRQLQRIAPSKTTTTLSKLTSTVKILRRPYSSASDYVRIVEVGPRDGLQNEKHIVPLETKIKLIDRLSGTGLKTIEAGAFVSPKWVPQMANSGDILRHLLSDPADSSISNGAPSIAFNTISRTDISYPFLVPNEKGLQTALKVRDEILSSSTNLTKRRNISEIAIFAAATESFSQKNINCSIAESLDRFRPVVDGAKAAGIRVRAYLSVVMGCPYEGPDVSASKVADLSVSLLEMGADELSLGDTTGMGTPPKTKELLEAVQAAGVPLQKVAMHLHDTYGQALVNSAMALDRGVRIFDSSVAGLGGCPYAKGATGNVASEDLIYFLHSLGLRSGVDLEKLSEIGKWISEQLSRENGSRAGKALLAKRDA
jgi:hydroxymethylglutaryl-CoA lyase